MRRLILTTMLICLHAVALGTEPEDSPATRKVAAERYASTYDLRQLLTEVTEAMAKDLPPEKRAEVDALLTRYVRIDALREAMIIAMVKHFTTRELNALADFYGSPEGKSAMGKLAVYMSDVMPMIEAEIQHAVEASRADKAKTPGA